MINESMDVKTFKILKITFIIVTILFMYVHFSLLVYQRFSFRLSSINQIRYYSHRDKNN